MKSVLEYRCRTGGRRWSLVGSVCESGLEMAQDPHCGSAMARTARAGHRRLQRLMQMLRKSEPTQPGRAEEGVSRWAEVRDEVAWQRQIDWKESRLAAGMAEARQGEAGAGTTIQSPCALAQRDAQRGETRREVKAEDPRLCLVSAALAHSPD